MSQCSSLTKLPKQKMFAQCVSVSQSGLCIVRLLLHYSAVIGFDAELYELDEQTGSQQLTISVLTPPASLTSSVTLQITAQSGNTSGEIDHNRMLIVWYSYSV